IHLYDNLSLQFLLRFKVIFCNGGKGSFLSLQVSLCTTYLFKKRIMKGFSSQDKTFDETRCE
ncbi:hypothetical protein MD537_27245, partial [Flavihumibacter sediminis]|nr:hypothetical protein [Flavihumibacter sediminis]